MLTRREGDPRGLGRGDDEGIVLLLGEISVLCQDVDLADVYTPRRISIMPPDRRRRDKQKNYCSVSCTRNHDLDSETEATNDQKMERTLRS